ncbi:MAG: kinetochore-associated Ndc80 complex subunit ndc80 [Phylliscum demangeonii]|nr:MAG: kinetochore-associated Ndc80 complex subunit ndc80 [Phylliscum demangeonii]
MLSQDSALFSVRRPRETLGAINYNSSIPQPASALKRSNSISGLQQLAGATAASHARSMSGSRASLAFSRAPAPPLLQRSSSGTNLADLGMSTVVKRSSSINGGGSSQYHPYATNGGGGRKSYAPGAAASLLAPPATTAAGAAHAAQQRRSSIYSRPSSMGPMSRQSFFAQAPVPAGVAKDPRPLRDRAYQAQIGQQLLDYLAQHGFEMEMKHALGPNAMKSPTQKDFNYMFQWLYHRLDPGYRFLRNIEQEVPPILKLLRYPFEKSITKSQIAAVGGQNWATFLGLLHWMMQLAVMLDRYEQGAYDDACAEAGVDVGPDRVIFDFLTGAYHDWLQVDDDNGGGGGGDDEAEKVLAPHIERMAANFDKANERYLEELAVLEAESASLHAQWAELEKSHATVAKLDTHFKILADDKRKFEDYNANMEGRAQRYEARIALLAAELDKTTAELAEAERDRAALQEAVDRQGISLQDIDRMNAERDRLQKGLDLALARLEEGKQKLGEQEVEASTRLDEVERAIEQYNTLCYQIGLIPSSAPNANGHEYELVCLATHQAPSTTAASELHATHPAHDRLLAEDGTGYQPQHVLNLDLRGAVKSKLMALRKEIGERRGVALEADEKNHELLDHIKEAIEDKRSEVDALGHKVRAAEEEFDKTKEVTTTQKIASDAQIEKMEKELAKMRAGLSESVQLMEQREMNTNIEYEQLSLRANARREELHTEVERILNDVIKFKVHVQKSLEDYEAFVGDEVEQELGFADDENDDEGAADGEKKDGVALELAILGKGARFTDVPKKEENDEEPVVVVEEEAG